VQQPESHSFGYAVYSKFPLNSAAEIALEDVRVPTYGGTVQIAETSFYLLLLHTVPPRSPGGLLMRNAHLRGIAELKQKTNLPIVVAGDLNISMWSPYYKMLIADTGLINTRQGFGILPSWQVQGGKNMLSKFLALPIDHFLVSKDIRVESMKIGGSIGSDHLPLETILAVP